MLILLNNNNPLPPLKTLFFPKYFHARISLQLSVHLSLKDTLRTQWLVSLEVVIMAESAKLTLHLAE